MSTLRTLIVFVILVAVVVFCPRCCLCLLGPPDAEGDYYPTSSSSPGSPSSSSSFFYDYPPLDYLPHNTLVQYHHHPHQAYHDLNNNQNNHNHNNNNNNYPGVTIRSPTRLDPSLSSPPSSPSISPSSPSSSTSPFPCTPEEIAPLMNVADLETVVRLVADLEGVTVADLLLSLAAIHGLYLQNNNQEPHVKKPLLDFQPQQGDLVGVRGGGLEFPAAESGPAAPSALQDVNYQGGARAAPTLAMRLPSPPAVGRWGEVVEESPTLQLTQQQQQQQVKARGTKTTTTTNKNNNNKNNNNQAGRLLDMDIGGGDGGVGGGRGIGEVPRATVVVMGPQDGGEDQLGVVARTRVDMGPRMALLDVLKEAQTVYALDNGPYRPNPYQLKVARMGAEGGCLGLVGRGDPSNTPLHLSVTRIHPYKQVVWQSVCLPRVSQLLVRRGDLILIAPR